MTPSLASSLNTAAHGQPPCAAARCGTRRPACRARAFTLVELLLVAAILSILAGIAAPRYASSLANYRLSSAARRVQTDIAAARAAARAQSASITMSLASGGYQIAPFTGPDGQSPYRVNLRADPFRIDTFAYDFGGDTSLRFSGYGTPSGGGTITLQLGAAQRRIIVDALSGDTRVE